MGTGARDVGTHEARSDESVGQDTEGTGSGIPVIRTPVDTLDTNVILYTYWRDPHVIPILRDIVSDEHLSLVVSTMTEAELFAYPH